jgi:hypothetical protein
LANEVAGSKLATPIDLVRRRQSAKARSASSRAPLVGVEGDRTALAGERMRHGTASRFDATGAGRLL